MGVGIKRYMWVTYSHDSSVLVKEGLTEHAQSASRPATPPFVWAMAFRGVLSLLVCLLATVYAASYDGE